MENTDYLLDAYIKVDTKLADAKILVERTLKERSSIVKTIAETTGTGPYILNGSQVRIMHKGGTYYFKATPKKNIEKDATEAESPLA